MNIQNNTTFKEVLALIDSELNGTETSNYTQEVAALIDDKQFNTPGSKVITSLEGLRNLLIKLKESRYSYIVFANDQALEFLVPWIQNRMFRHPLSKENYTSVEDGIKDLLNTFELYKHEFLYPETKEDLITKVTPILENWYV